MIDYTAVPRTRQDLDVSDIPVQRRGLTYVTPDGGKRTFDLYYPTDGDGPFPVLVSVAGGGWFFGHPTSSHLGQQIHTAISRGYAFASMACTSSGEKKFPYQIHELNLFLYHLHEHRVELRLDTDFLALFSSSSGAHLSLLTALTQGQRYFDPWDNVPPICAVAAIYPPCRLDATDQDFEALGLRAKVIHSGPRCAEAIFLGVEDVLKEPDLVRLSSPTYQITPNAPPIMIFQGTADGYVPYSFTQEFIRRYREVVGTEKVLACIVPEADHSDPRFKNAETCHSVMDFFDRTRLGETPCPPWRQGIDMWEL